VEIRISADIQKVKKYRRTVITVGLKYVPSCSKSSEMAHIMLNSTSQEQEFTKSLDVRILCPKNVRCPH